jgi:branched-chain amino acid transport system ATP-binding protein
MEPMLALERADVFYDTAQALHHVDVQVGAGEIVSLIGRNGAGKSTTLKALMGLLPCRTGRRLFEGRVITALPPHLCSRAGIAYVPEDRQVFSTLTTAENLLLASWVGRRGAWTVNRVYDLFPRLRERRSARASSLSGGEQQMLVIGRALLSNPKVLLLDEPTEGLAPLVARDVANAIRAINEDGIAVLLVEQNFRIALDLATRHYVIDSGQVLWSGDTPAFVAGRADIERMIAV